MKRKWLGLALAAVMACAGAATGTEYTDNSGNYPEGWNNGTNGGEGFGAWKIVETSGASGWVGHGLWNPAANSFTGTWDGKTQAFGMIGKGAGFSVTASRAFRKALAAGDSFQLDMGVNWDANIDGAHKGFVLTAGGKDILEINHGNFPGHIYLNGDDSCDIWNEAPNQELGEPLYPMTWKFTAKDATTLTISANSRKDAETVYEEDFEVETSAIDGFRLQSVEQDNQDEDRRQSYYDNFVLDVEGPLPDLRNLTLAEKDGVWAVTKGGEQNLTFVVGRDTIEGEVAVRIASSDSFVELSSDEVVLADGVDSIEVPATATLYANANLAAITVEAVGYTSPAEAWEIKGPKYDWDADAWQLNDGQACTLWVNHWPSVYPDGDDGLISVTSSDSSVVKIELNEDWKTDTENPQHTYASWKVTAVGGGKATANVSYDGVELGTWGFEVIAAGGTLSGPATMRVGDEKPYTLSVTLAGDIESDTFRLVADDDSLVSIDPPDAQELTASGPLVFNVKALAEGEVELSVVDDKGLDAKIAPLTVTITEAPDYDDYIAYDDASFYDTGDLDYTATGVGTEKFQAWTEVSNNNDPDAGFYAGARIVSSAPDEAVLTDGKTFALYSNGGTEESRAEIKIRRPFANSLSAGQEFSVLISPNYRDGAKGVVLQGEWEGNWYDRVEFYYSGDYYSYKINGGEPVSLGWEYGTKLIGMSLMYEADGSSYTLTFSREGEEDVVVEDLSFEGTVDGALFYSWNGGFGDENNFVFNRPAIEQVAEPVEYREIGIIGTWNPDAIGDYEFFVGPAEEGEAIGTVALTVEPADGRIVIEPASVEVPGDDVAAFTVKVTSLPEEGVEAQTYTITATPADELVLPAVFYVTPSRPYLYLTSDNWEYNVDDGTIWLTLHASPSYYGTYNITTDNEEVLGIPEASTPIVLSEDNAVGAAFDVNIVGAGEASIYATLDTDPEVYTDYHFTINPGPDPAGDVVPVKAISIKDGEMMTLTLDGKGSQVFGATEVKDGGWVWQALDLAIIGDGTSVTLPMDAPTMMFKVECEKEEE